MSKNLASILGMAAALTIAFAIDLLTKELLSRLNSLEISGTQIRWTILCTQVLFATTMVLLARFTLSARSRGGTVPAVFIVMGSFILLAATPAFMFTIANAPSGSLLRAILSTGPLFPMDATRRLVEAAAFIVAIGTLRLLSRTSPE